MVDTNASHTQSGFHYQDFCALYFFIKNIKKIDEINNEGKEDFDILYTDGKISYFQVKEVANNKTLGGEKIRKSLSVLSDDYTTLEKDVELVELGVVTNTSLPFGKKSDNSFNQPYMKYKYEDLSDDEKKVIDNVVSKNQIESVDANFLNKLTITRIQYQGSDEQSKYQELRKIVEEIVHESGMSGGLVKSLMNEWIVMFTHNTEYPNSKIGKDAFTAHTEMVALDSPNFDEFFNVFDDYGVSEEYIKNEYHLTLERFCLEFEIKNKIESELFDFGKSHKKIESRLERHKLFTNEFAPKLARMFDLSEKNPDELGIAKLIIWLIIKKQNMCEKIERCFNLENN